jgi:hypothetical protein
VQTDLIQKTNNPRILGLDLLRGYFMFVIIVNHIERFPSIYDIITGRGLFWVSAAEGFFLISGLLIGYVYGPKFTKNAKKTTKKIWLRSGKLYLWSVFFTLLFTFWGISAGLPPGTKLDILQTNLSNLIYQTLTLQYVYGWADYWVHFVVFIFFAPLALYFIAKRKWWLILIASAAIWAFRGTSFNMGWQILFFFGIVAGYYLPVTEKKFKVMTKPLQKKISYLVVGIAVGAIIFNGILIYLSNLVKNSYSYVIFLPNFVSSTIILLNNFYSSTGTYFEKNILGIGRLSLDFICFIALYLVVRKYETQIANRTFGIFETLGKSPLFVYGLSAVILYPLHIWMVSLPSNVFYNFILDTAVLAFIYLAARYRKHVIDVAKNMTSKIREYTTVHDKKEAGLSNE